MPSAARKRPSAAKVADQQHEEASRRDRVIDELLDGTKRYGSLSGIDLAQRVHHAGGELLRRHLAANDEISALGSLLGYGVVDLRVGLALNAGEVHVGDGADDARDVAACINDVPDGVTVGIQMTRGGFIEDDNWVSLYHIAFCIANERLVFPGEVASLDRNAHCGEIARGDHVDERALALDLVFGCADEMGDAPAAIAREGQIVRDACVFDAGQRGDTADHILKDCRALCIIAAIVEVNIDCGSIGWLKAEVNVEDAQEAAHEQAGTDEQHTGECDLRG